MESLQFGEKKGEGVREEMVKTYRISRAKPEGLFTKFLPAGTGGCLLKLARN